MSVYFIVLLELKKKFSDGSRRFEFEWVISGQGKSQIFKTFSDGSELFEFEGRDNKVNEHGKYLCLRIFNNPYPRQIRVRGAEFSCPRGVRGPRPRGCAWIRADATSIRGPPSGFLLLFFAIFCKIFIFFRKFFFSIFFPKIHFFLFSRAFIRLWC